LVTLLFLPAVTRLSIAERLSKEEDCLALLEQWVLFFRDIALVMGACEGLVYYRLLLPHIKEVTARRKYTFQEVSDITTALLTWTHIAKTTNVNTRLLLENMVLML